MMHQDLYKILQFAFSSHSGQLRDDGQPYITHPIAVSMILSNHGIVSFNHLAVALLHDVMEDCDVDYRTIEALSSEFVADCVLALTKFPEKTYTQYYKGIQKSIVTADVKIADRIHNLHTMKDVWDIHRVDNYVRHTKKCFDPWGFNTPFLGKELTKAVEDAEKWIGE